MLKNYLKIALRHLQKHKGYAVINISGLAIGLACCLLIVLFVRDEVSYDRFHEKAERTYRIVRQERDLEPSVTPAAPLAPTLMGQYPEVLRATRLFQYWFTPLVSRGEEGSYEKQVVFTDTAFFDVFSFRFVRGDPATALDEPFSMVLTETTARKYFDDEDPIGQTLTMNAAHAYTVTGILEDPPRASHFTFDILASIESLPAVMNWPDVLEGWGLGAFPTYLVLPEGYDPARLEARLTPAETEAFGEPANIRYFLQPLTNIHLYSNYRGEVGATSDVRYVWLLSGIALIILLLACINYTNLATARFARRAKEVGVRKAVGAHRRQLMSQFLGESLLLSGLALLVALALLEGLLPAFSTLIGGKLTFDLADDYDVLAILAGMALAAGLLAGSYPAFYLSAFRPGVVLKGAPDGPRRGGLRRILVVTQYAIAVALLAGAGVMYQQLDYIQAKRLGFETEQMMVLPLRDEAVTTRPDVAKRTFLQAPDVTHVAASTSLPGDVTARATVQPEGALQEEPFSINVFWVDHDYIDTFGMEMAAGRTFSPDFPTDTEAVVLNETAVRAFGWAAPAEALGHTVRLWGADRTVVGVVKDFHYASLREQIGPVLFFPEFDGANGLILRLNTNDLPATKARLEAAWKQLSTAQPFTYTFLNQNIEKLYVAETRWGKLIGGAALFALVIACLGLFGLASFLAEQRTKEIGVRKALGASAAGIAVLLSSDFARLVLLGFVVGAPLAYLAAGRWLDGFAYRIDVAWWIFPLAGVLALGIALLTVSYQSIKAALADPVKALRYE